ncbi:hypothetical protein JTB14_019779 [Gonioctena quinquepunctata]|nr:hypothetical protein JTB14_019779 [Gonioctena quinquepunctata]
MDNRNRKRDPIGTYRRTEEHTEDEEMGKMNLQENIKRTAREWTQRALDHLEKNERNDKNEYIPYLKLKETNLSTIYNHWIEKLTDENKNEIVELKNRMKIVGTDEGVREEFTPPFQVKEGRKVKPTNGTKQFNKQQTSRPGTSADIEISNQFGILASEGESSVMETEEAVEKEEETSKIRNKQRGGNKPKQTPQINIEREPNKEANNKSKKGKKFNPVPQTSNEETPETEQDQGQKARKQQQQGTKERNIPRIIVEKEEPFDEHDSDESDHEEIIDHNTNSEQDIADADGTNDQYQTSARPFIAKDKTCWKKHKPPRKPIRTRQENIIKRLPGSTSKTRHLKQPIEIWKYFITEEMISEIVTCTNLFIEKSKDNFSRERDARKTDAIEICALLGLIYMAGLTKSNKLNIGDLWRRDGASDSGLIFAKKKQKHIIGFELS